MTGDIRRRLIEALDRQEAEARAGTSDIAPGWLLRLIERERKVLNRHRPELQLDGQRPSDWCAGCDYEHIVDCLELQDAAAFWLGTPEPDRLVIVPDGQGKSIAEEYDWPEPVGGGGPVKRATRKPKRGRLGTPEGSDG